MLRHVVLVTFVAEATAERIRPILADRAAVQDAIDR